MPTEKPSFWYIFFGAQWLKFANTVTWNINGGGYYCNVVVIYYKWKHEIVFHSRLHHLPSASKCIALGHYPNMDPTVLQGYMGPLSHSLSCMGAYISTCHTLTPHPTMCAHPRCNWTDHVYMSGTATDLDEAPRQLEGHLSGQPADIIGFFDGLVWHWMQSLFWGELHTKILIKMEDIIEQSIKSQWFLLSQLKFNNFYFLKSKLSEIPASWLTVICFLWFSNPLQFISSQKINFFRL